MAEKLRKSHFIVKESTVDQRRISALGRCPESLYECVARHKCHVIYFFKREVLTCQNLRIKVLTNRRQGSLRILLSKCKSFSKIDIHSLLSKNN